MSDQDKQTSPKGEEKDKVTENSETSEDATLQNANEVVPIESQENSKVKPGYVEEIFSSIETLKEKQQDAEVGMKNLERDNILLWKQLTRLSGQCMEQKAILQQMGTDTSEDSEDGGKLANQDKDEPTSVEVKNDALDENSTVSSTLSKEGIEAEAESSEKDKDEFTLESNQDEALEAESEVSKIELRTADVMKMKEMIKAKVEEIIKIKKNKSDSKQEPANENQNESILNGSKDEMVETNLELSDSSSFKGNEEMDMSEKEKDASTLNGSEEEIVEINLELSDSSSSKGNEEMDDVSEKEKDVSTLNGNKEEMVEINLELSDSSSSQGNEEMDDVSEKEKDASTLNGSKEEMVEITELSDSSSSEGNEEMDDVSEKVKGASTLSGSEGEMVVINLELSDSSSSQGNEEMDNVSEKEKDESTLNDNKDETVETNLEPSEDVDFMNKLSDSSSSKGNEEMFMSEKEKEASVLENSELSNILECQLEEEETPSTEWAEKLQRWQKPSLPIYPAIEYGFTFNKIPAGDAVFTHEEFFNLRILYPALYKKLSFSFLELKGGSAKERNLHHQALIRILNSGGFLTEPVPWLLKKKFAKAVTVCSDCSGKKLQIIKTPAFFDHHAFCCLNIKCKRVLPFIRPPFFDRYPYKLATLLVVVYHWVCQSDVSELLKDSLISTDELMILYKDIQFICSVEVEQNDRKRIVMPDEILEVSAFQYGLYVIVAAMSKNLVIVRFKVVSCNTNYLKDELVKAAALFVHPNHYVVSDCNVFSDLKFYCLGFRPIASLRYGDCKTLKNFMKTHVQSHLEKFSPSYFSLDVLQGILNELEWRQRFCDMALMNCYDSAFWAILRSLCCKNIVKGVTPHLYKHEIVPRERLRNRDHINLTIYFPNDEAAAAVDSHNNEMTLTTFKMLESEGFCRSMIAVANASKGNKSSRQSFSSVVNDYLRNVMCIVDGDAPFSVTGLLSIKTWPLVSHLMDIIKYSVQPISFDASAWKEKLTQEEFFFHPVQWLVKNHFAPGNIACDTCKGGAAFYDFDEAEFFKCKYRCVKVSKQPFKRPKFYTWFCFPMRDLLKLLYHWASQSPIDAIQEHVRLSEGEIRYLFWAVQKHCSSILEQSSKFGNKGHVIEVGLIQYGKFCILGAFNRQTKDIRLKVFYAPDLYPSSMFEPILKEWLGPCTLIVTTLPGFRLSNYVIVHVKEKQDWETSFIHIDKYLLSLVSGLFAGFRTIEVNSHIIQSYIDEIVWRQTYGNTPEKAFLSLLSQLSYDNVIGYDQLIEKNAFSTAETTPQVLNQVPFALKPCTSNDEESNRKRPADTNLVPPVSQKNIKISDSASYCPEIKREPSPDLVSSVSVSPNEHETISVVEIMGETDPIEVSSKSKRRLWTLKKSNALLLQPVLEDAFSYFKRQKEKRKKLSIANGEYVAVDELYFARLDVPKNPSHTPVLDIYICNLCKFVMYGNILAMGHALEHAAEEQKKNSSDICFCEHCFLEFDSEEELTYHITEVHVHMNSLACLICSELFFSSEELIDHMKEYHVPCEMPYSCPACPYRSSLHKEVLSHFRLTHQYEPHLVCPYCLKMCSPHVKKQEILNVNVYCKHVLKHKTLNSNLKCPSCCLLFFSDKELLSHRIKEHRSFINSQDAVPFIPRQNPSVIVMKNTVQYNQYPHASTLILKPAELAHDNQINQTRIMQPIHPQANVTSQPINPQPNAKNSLQQCNSTLTLPQQSNSSFNNVMLIQSLPVRTEVEDERDELNNVEKPSRCLECANPVDENHFFKLLRCPCNYSTRCSKAFRLHMVNKHSVVKEKAPSVLFVSPAILQKGASCSCSFSSKNGDVLASHLKTCPGVIKTVNSEFTTPKQKGPSRRVQLHQLSSSKLSVSGVCVKVNDALASAVDSSQMPYSYDGGLQMATVNNPMAYYSGQVDNASVNCVGAPVCIPLGVSGCMTQRMPAVRVGDSYSLSSEGQVVYSYSYPQVYNSAMDNNLISYGTAVDPSATPSFCYVTPTNDVIPLSVIPQTYSEQNTNSACKIDNLSNTATGSQLPFQIIGSSSLAQNSFPKSSAFVLPSSVL